LNEILNENTLCESQCRAILFFITFNVLVENKIDVKFICTIFTIDSIPNLSIFPIERKLF
jgi:hypothetical protein